MGASQIGQMLTLTSADIPSWRASADGNTTAVGAQIVILSFAQLQNVNLTWRFPV
jgi:hypothetical protein